MFNVRPKERTSRELQPMARYSATHDAIPLQDNWNERWCTLTQYFETAMADMLNFEVRPEDVFVVTFMKCGTTWMQETAWLLMNNLDYERAKQAGVLERSIFLDFAGLFEGMPDIIQMSKEAPNPRLLKSHLPMNLLPKQLWEKKQKTIYVARNVKDVVVSSFHFVKGLGTWAGSLDEFVDDFMNEAVLYTPFWAHIVDFWKMRNESYIFFVTYEEMKRDLSDVMQRLCTFLGRPQLTEEELKMAVTHLSFENMKANEKTNITGMLKDTMPDVNENFQFMRRGIVGAYKDELLPEHRKKLDDWSKEFLDKHGIKQEAIFGNI